MKIKIGETEFDVADAAGAAIQRELATAQSIVTAARAERDQAVATRDQAQGRADALDRELKTKAEDAKKTEQKNTEAKTIAERVELVALATPILQKPIETVARMDSSELMVEVLKVADPEFKPEGKSADYIRGVFDRVVASRTDSADQSRRAGGGAIFHAPRTDTDSDDSKKAREEEEKARQKMIEDKANAWKPKANV